MSPGVIVQPGELSAQSSAHPTAASPSQSEESRAGEAPNPVRLQELRGKVGAVCGGSRGAKPLRHCSSSRLYLAFFLEQQQKQLGDGGTWGCGSAQTVASLRGD